MTGPHRLRGGTNIYELMFVTAFAALPIGMVLPGLQHAIEASDRAKSQYNIKRLGFGCMAYHEAHGYLPHNGGANTVVQATKVNYGWHTPAVMHSGSWVTQICPWVDEQYFHKFNRGTSLASTTRPPYLNSTLHTEVKVALCPQRARPGFKTGGIYQGPVTDYAINWFINAPPIRFNAIGWASASWAIGANGDWACSQNGMTINGIFDGAANTILLGSKALPPLIGTVNQSASGDEGIMSPGNWVPPATRNSTGTARGHRVSTTATAASYQIPGNLGAGYAWMFRDSEISVTTAPGFARWVECFGGPFAGGVHFCFADGSVKIVSYNVRGKVIFGRMLYPNDGN